MVNISLLPLSSFNSFIFVDDFERYTNSIDVYKFWKWDTDKIYMDFSDDSYPATVSQDLSNYNAVAFMAKGNQSFDFKIYFTDNNYFFVD